MARAKRIFKTDRRIRLGIWGLGRGMSFYRACEALNIDVVAGCDYNAHMRERFLQNCPDAFATASDEEFLAHDFDAVLLATYCPAHAGDAIRCLQAGKHVLSEVTAFHTPAEGVALVEAVQKSGRVYQMAENYPYTAPNMLLRHYWREGLFGDLMYAEYEYVHECRPLCYTYIDGVPVEPGWTVHNWRSWIHFHYYNTHSLGPVMHITGTRPVRVTSLPGKVGLAGYPMPTGASMKGIAPSLIELDNGAVMRNLMGATTSDAHHQRLWGTRGAAELNQGRLYLRLGASGHSPRMEVTPRWPELAEEAASTGHGGGDFWVLYFFANEILNGEKGFFDVYRSADCTLPGILAYRSSLDNGQPYDIPDLRRKTERDKHRDDHFAQDHPDAETMCFPKRADRGLTGEFTTIMRDLIAHATAWRAYADWARVIDDARDPQRVVELLDPVIENHGDMARTMEKARRLADAYPRSQGSRVLREMLALADEERLRAPGFLSELKTERRKLKRKANARD